MGPGFFQPYITQDAILDIKEGHGETMLFEFAYNILWLRFLKVTDQSNESTMVKALKGLAKSKFQVCMLPIQEYLYYQTRTHLLLLSYATQKIMMVFG